MNEEKDYFRLLKYCFNAFYQVNTQIVSSDFRENIRMKTPGNAKQASIEPCRHEFRS